MRLLLQPASCLEEGAVWVRRTLPWLLAAVTVDAMAATAHSPPSLAPEMLACRTNTAGNGCSVRDLVFWPGVLDKKKLSVLDMELEAFVASFKG